MLTRGRMLYFAISRKSARATNPDARRRLSLLHGGASISMTPLFILIVVNLVLGRPAIENSSALFTFSEAMNPANEEWGEERLVACDRTLQKETAPEMIAELIASADQFAAGAKQHDDMTVIVARVLKLPS